MCPTNHLPTRQKVTRLSPPGPTVNSARPVEVTATAVDRNIYLPEDLRHMLEAQNKPHRPKVHLPVARKIVVLNMHMIVTTRIVFLWMIEIV